MKLTKSKLKQIIKEELNSIIASPGVRFDWTQDGLTMEMHVWNENEHKWNVGMTFSTQKDVQNLITQLQNLLTGPMRTSP